MTDKSEFASRTDPTRWDADGDGLIDPHELNRWKTNPITVDTDGDARGPAGNLAPSCSTDSSSRTTTHPRPWRTPTVTGGATSRNSTISHAPGETREVVVDMRAAPVLEGSVVATGAPVAGARVVLTSRPVKTAAIALGDASRILYTQPIADLPFARRETTSDANGTFELPWWSTGTSGSAPQHLYVVAASGTILHQREVETRTPTLVAEW